MHGTIMLLFYATAVVFGFANFVLPLQIGAPGMTMWRLPIFTWAILVTSVLILIAFPVLTAALFGLASDRHFGSHVFDPANGGAILYQHLFWFFGHPEVYIIALPFFGIISEVIPVFSRKPLFGYRGMVYALLGIAALSVAVWAHHMFATGAVLLPFFSFMTFLIAIPTGLKFFNWIGTMWKGQVSFETPMLFAAGFLVTFLFGGLTGVILAAPALDFHVSDSYFVVAHFHYVLFGTIVFATYSGIYFWFPKMTGRFLDERLGRLHFWATFIGFHMTFLIQHWLGNIGMPRRYPDYLPTDGFTLFNTISTIGAFVLGASTLPFIWNIIRSWRYGEITTADDPWGYGNSLEWATSSPPPRHNFTSLPRIRSERPAFELHHPYMIERMRTEAHPARGWKALDEREASSALKIPEGDGAWSSGAPFKE
jgi:cytochrome c oxidase subunit 1